MNAERNLGLQICPYWRRYIRYGDAVLALCGRESLEESPLVAKEGARLSQCPFVQDEESLAFLRPAIVEFVPDPEFTGSLRDFARIHLRDYDYLWLWLRYSLRNVLLSGKAGREGIAELEEAWPQAEEEFIQCHSQPQ